MRALASPSLTVSVRWAKANCDGAEGGVAATAGGAGSSAGRTAAASSVFGATVATAIAWSAPPAAVD